MLITKIVVSESVVEIGSGAFKGCNSLVEITIPFVGKAATTDNAGDAVFGFIFGDASSSVAGTISQDIYQRYYYIPSSIRSVTVPSSRYPIRPPAYAI